MTAPHIAVIDDEPELCELLFFRLEHHGYRVSWATSAERGLQMLAGDIFDAVVLDLRLGDACGLDLLPVVGQRLPQLPVIVLTAHGNAGSALEAARRGAKGFLAKPFHDRELLEMLAQVLGANRRPAPSASPELPPPPRTAQRPSIR